MGIGSGTAFTSNNTTIRCVGGASGSIICLAYTGPGCTLAAGASAFTASSDERLKTIITDNPYPNALDDILTLKPIRYRWKYEDTGRDQIGLIAQSVLPIVPEAISTHAALEGDDTEYYSLRYCEVIPLLVSSVQQLTTQLQAAMDRITNLETQAAQRDAVNA